jgi:dUTP pyrophosphatase
MRWREIAPLYTTVDERGYAPQRQHSGDVGWDLSASVDVAVPPGKLVDIPTGVRMALPEGIWLLLTARSSTFRRHQLMVLDGVIDSGFRGELLVSVYNLGSRTVQVAQGWRLAQVIPHRNFTDNLDLLQVSELLFDALPAVDSRGVSGFGSTG